MTTSLLLITFAAVFLSGAVQATTGFGFSLVAVPVLSLAADPRTAVVATSLASLSLTISVAIQERRHAHWRIVPPLMAAFTLGMPVGLLVLSFTPQRLLIAIIGTFVIICTILIFCGLRLSVSTLGVLGLGALTGTLATATGAGGPLLTAAFQAMGYQPRRFRATVTAIFAGCGIITAIGFAVAQQITSPVLAIGLAGLPAAIMGWWAGNLVFRRLNSRQFKRLVLASLTISGAALLVRAAVG